jgi:hypothetical protein
LIPLFDWYALFFSRRIESIGAKETFPIACEPVCFGFPVCRVRRFGNG